MKKHLTLENIGMVALLLLLAIAGYVLFTRLSDCLRGQDIVVQGYLYDRSHKEAWTEVYTPTETYTDSRGRLQSRPVVRTEYHPEEFYLHVRDMSSSRAVEVSRELYYHYRTGDMVPIRKRIGKTCHCTCWERVF